MEVWLLFDLTISGLLLIEYYYGVTCHLCAIICRDNTSQAYDQRTLDTLKPGGFFVLGGRNAL